MSEALNLIGAVSKLPALYSHEEDGSRDAKTVKLFTPDAQATWYLTEYNPEDRIAFGFACLGDTTLAELGYVSLDELTTLRGHLGLPVEVDLYWDGTLAEGYEALGVEVPAWL